MRVRWYHAPFLYGLGVLLGLLVFGLAAFIRFRVFVDSLLVYMVLLGAYSLPHTVFLWISLIVIAEVLGDVRPRLSALLCVGTGLAVSLFGLFVVLPDVFSAIG